MHSPFVSILTEKKKCSKIVLWLRRAAMKTNPATTVKKMKKSQTFLTHIGHHLDRISYCLMKFTVHLHKWNNIERHFTSNLA